MFSFPYLPNLADSHQVGFDITKLGTGGPYQSKSFVSSGSVGNIYIDDHNADIEITSSADGKVHITYYENDKEHYDISESADGDLVVKSRTSRKWYDYVFVFELERPKLLMEVPSNFSGDITVKSSDGFIHVDGIGADDLLLSSLDDNIKIQKPAVFGRLL